MIKTIKFLLKLLVGFILLTVSNIAYFIGCTAGENYIGYTALVIAGISYGLLAAFIYKEDNVDESLDNVQDS